MAFGVGISPLYDYAFIKAAAITLSGLSGGAVTATALIPVGSFLFSVTARVITEITGAKTWRMGDGSDVDRWGTALLLTVGTIVGVEDYTADGFGQFSAAGDVVLTANGPNFTAGAVKLIVYYIVPVVPSA